MSYFFRRAMLHRRERIACSNPYHDELGRFTTAEDAVMFVRPRSGYNDGQMTPDPAWRGAYMADKRFGIRRERNQQGEGAVVRPTPTQQEFLANVVAATTPAPTPDLIAIAQQLASPTGESVPYPSGQPSAIPDPLVAALGPTHASLHQSIAKVVEAPTGDWYQIKNTLQSAGLEVKANWEQGVNNSVTIKMNGEKFQLKHVTDRNGIGAEGEALGARLVKELGINVRTQGVTYLRGADGAEYALTEWVNGKPPKDVGLTAVQEATENTGRDEVFKLMMFEALSGDSDKHVANYVISDDKKIVGMDYSRIGDYGTARGPGFNSVVLNSMTGTVSTAGLTEFLAKAYDVVKREVIPRIPTTGISGRKRSADGKPLFHTDGRAAATRELDKRYNTLLTLITSGPTLDVERVAREIAYPTDVNSWGYRRFPFVVN